MLLRKEVFEELYESGLVKYLVVLCGDWKEARDRGEAVGQLWVLVQRSVFLFFSVNADD